MAEAPDAQFVAEDAVFVYHKKFSVTLHDDHDLTTMMTPILPFLQENWFHDCDNEHAKITAFFQVSVSMRRKLIMKSLPAARRKEQKQFADSSLSRFSFFLSNLTSTHLQGDLTFVFASGRAEQGARIN